MITKQSIISDKAIIMKMEENGYVHPYVNFGYTSGAKQMRDLMLKEIVEPLVEALDEIKDIEFECASDIAKRALREHEELVGEK